MRSWLQRIARLVVARKSVAGGVALLFAAIGIPVAAALTPGAGLAVVNRLTVPPRVDREFRAAWVTPVSDLGFRDWPSKPGLPADSQKAELRALLDEARDIGLNAVVLHVRIAGDAMYPTKLAPWSYFLTGHSGESPGYDPLAYAIDQAHARGLQLHAWFNPFRALMPNVLDRPARSHVTRQHPEWIRKYGEQTWIDPGEPAARRASLNAILDVVRRYDVDGIHIDDYFYPYREQETVTRRVHHRRVRVRRDIPFPDDRTWKKYGRNKGWTDRAAWRRANIDDFVETLYHEVKAIKPTVLVGVSPFGIWRSGTPHGVTGLDAFGEIYADSRRWLREGWLDYLAPQLYWPLDGTQDRFRALDAWWRSQNPHDRHIWPGLYTSRVYDPRNGWPMGEIAAQVTSIRDASIAAGDAPGHIHFRMGALMANGDALGERLADGAYSTPALVPAFPWLDSRVPAPPRVTLLRRSPEALTIVPGDSVPVRWWLVQTRGKEGVWRSELRPAGRGAVGAGAFETSTPDEIAVTAIGDAGLASIPTLVGIGTR